MKAFEGEYPFRVEIPCDAITPYLIYYEFLCKQFDTDSFVLTMDKGKIITLFKNEENAVVARLLS